MKNKNIKKGIAPLFFVSTLVLAGNCNADANTVARKITNGANIIAREITDGANSAAEEIMDAPDTITVDAIAAFATASINERVDHVKLAVAAASAAAGRGGDATDTIRSATEAGVEVIETAANTGVNTIILLTLLLRPS